VTERAAAEIRLQFWPRLATLPSTNGLLALVMALWLLTGSCALLFALLEHYHAHAPGTAALAVSDRWYQALEIFTGIVVVQFIGKRGTDAVLWRRSRTAPKEGEGGERGQ
jgi:hypothetical protein